jgi:hypothetical protein
MPEAKEKKVEAPKREKPDTPSAVALDAVGQPAEGEDAAEYAERYNAAKRKVHRGW